MSRKDNSEVSDTFIQNYAQKFFLSQKQNPLKSF